MYKIGIDARLYSQTGVGVYLRNLLHFLEKIEKNNIQFYVYLLPDDFNSISFTNQNFSKRLIYSPWHTFSEQINFATTLYRDKLDLMHFTYFSYPVLYKRKFIATIHDSTPLSFKTGKASTKNSFLYEVKFQAFKFVISQQVKNAQVIITPTNSVKNQLTNIFGDQYKSKIKSIYEGVDYELIRIHNSELRIQNFKKKDFFIYIGNFYPHKNVENLVKAFSKVRASTKLILIGPDDFFAKRLTQLIKQLKQEGRIVFYHNPSKKDLVFFYKNASALIHPSLSEGFGLPIIESMYFNLPIIASDIEVFKEILGNKYISFNPKDPSNIVKKIEYFQKNRKKIDYGNTGEKFSFKRMTQKTFDLYNQTLGRIN